jgi:hypothetical protein
MERTQTLEKRNSDGKIALVTGVSRGYGAGISSVCALEVWPLVQESVHL